MRSTIKRQVKALKASPLCENHGLGLGTYDPDFEKSTNILFRIFHKKGKKRNIYVRNPLLQILRAKICQLCKN
jgi:hypothetical protein